MYSLQEPPLLLDAVTQEHLKQWLEGSYDPAVKTEIQRLLAEDPRQLVDAFYTHLAFGTGGLRGLMGIGCNRMNVYTVRATTQGLAAYIWQQSHALHAAPSVLVGHDSRHHSREFAEETAKVLAANRIRVYLYSALRPTPLVSFGCRYKNCLAAVMITASHNPAEYNGYKVFWSDGGQVLPPHDQAIMRAVAQATHSAKIELSPSLSHPLITAIDSEIDQAYLAAMTALQHYPQTNHTEGSRCRIIYSSLHGTGITMVPQALRAWGFSNIAYVEQQIIPDGSFPTVTSPNPEEPAALAMGIELMLATESDLFLATDPDSDRVGVAVRHAGQAVLLNGNQIACICLEHICAALSAQNRLNPRAAFIKTIGTTELFQAICDAYQRPCFNVLTGFKYIAEKIHLWDTLPEGRDYEYLFGGEESYGYLLGTFTRDKDAVTACALIAEVALQAKLKGRTLVDNLQDLYHRYGIYQEALLSIEFGETKEGKEAMAASMHRLRQTPLSEINGISIISVDDYLSSTRLHLASGEREPLALALSNVLVYWLSDGSKVMIRPSGTEPKVKLYVGACQKTFSSLEQGQSDCQRRCQEMLHALREIFLKPHL